MISKLRIQNFKCLKDVQLDLAPLTVLIGPNDSGKTSLLEALRLPGEAFLARPIFFSDGQPGTYAMFRSRGELESVMWRRDSRHPMEWKFDISADGMSGDVGWMLGNASNMWIRLGGTILLQLDIMLNTLSTVWAQITERVRAEAEQEQILRCLSQLQTSAIYKFNPVQLRSPSVPSAETLASTGQNLAAILDTMMTGTEREGFNELERTLKQECPTLKGITLRTGRDSNLGVIKSIEYLLAGTGKVAIPAVHASDGVMLLTAYLALAYGNTPEIILLEEPENGLHPSRLKMIVDLLRKMTTGEVGNRKRQIILTTHSPLLLNCCQKEEVRIVRRNEEGATTVTPMAEAPGIDKLLGEFAIGELWYLLGEEGLLKGQRP